MAILNRSRIEYVQWGVNWINGCNSDCAYCYARKRDHSRTDGDGTLED